MEENFTLWNDGHPDHVVHSEEVICGIDAQEDVCEEVVVEDDVVTETIISDSGLVEEEMTVQEQEEEIEEEVMYVTGENVIVMPQRQSSQPVVTFQDNFMDCQVTEEIITDDWVNPQSGEERDVIIPVGEVGAEQQIEYDDTEIPLPTDQDEYTASRPYPCDFCSRRFRKKANLMNHMVAHQTDRPHGCNLCGARYIRKCDLMNHLKIHAYVPDADLLDNEEQSYQEEEPEVEKKRGKKGKKRKGGKLKIKEEGNEYEARTSYDYVEEDVRLLNEMEHSVYQEEEEEEVPMPEARYPILDPRKPFVCQHCGVAFAREKALASHARIHAGDSPFECETCNEMFWDVTLLREHVRLKHGNTAALESDYEDIDDDDYVDDSKYGDFYCKVCGMRFHRMDLLRRHMRSHEENIKEELYQADEEDDYQGHVCNVCGQSFEEALDLLAHAEQHARSGGGHRCMLCGECFTDETQMSTHVMQRHGKNMPQNTCMLCGKTCKDRRTLLKHSWDHSREKLFSCSKCAKSFHNKARLKRHMMSHRNKAVSCDICGEDFPDGRSLMNHRHSHSNVSGRQFPCRECGKSFGSRSSQQIHIRIHTGERPYGCRFCWKAFADGGTLRKHERIHTGEKPYACAVCPRAFNQRVVLREHIRSHHSGPDPNYSNTMTPYCCGVCNDMFSTSQDLIIHLIHHCDLNTAMKRQPQIGPRKYKRRRKLKPHELEMISNREDVDIYSDQEEKVKRRVIKKPKSPPKTTLEKDYESVFQSFESALQNISSIVNSPPQAKPQSARGRKKSKSDHSNPVNPRPKMIHTQKTRVPTDDGKRKTKTLITRTQPTETQPKDLKLQQQQQQQNDRIRPRTKNVSYHVLQPDKLPVATFGDAEIDPPADQPDYQTVLIKPDPDRVIEPAESQQLLEPELQEEEVEMEYEQVETEIPDIANEETILAQEEEIPAPNPVSIIKVTKAKKNNSLRPGRHIIGPGNKVIRIVKGGLIVKNNNKREHEPETLLPDNPPHKIKQEVLEPSPLHELAEISMQHAQNQFRCEMCCATFTDRSQLLMHVPIHI